MAESVQLPPMCVRDDRAAARRARGGDDRHAAEMLIFRHAQHVLFSPRARRAASSIHSAK